MRTIAKVVGLAAIVALLAYTYYAFVQAQNLNNFPVSISVTGKGEITARPDIATFNFSVTAKEADAATAQSKAADSVNAILAYLKTNGVEDKDIKQSGYNLFPRYEYPRSAPCTQWDCPPAGEPKLVGYEVSQSIDVKVRATENLGKLVAGVGEMGATNIGTPSFTIDDEEKLKADARALAIEDAEAQVKVLAEKLGVRVVRMTGYWEEEGGGYPMPMYGYGGNMDMAKAESSVVPEMPSGENTITSRVNLTFEVK